MHLFDRKFQDLLRGRTVLEKWIIIFAAVLSCAFLVLAVMKIRGIGIFAVKSTTCTSDECLISASTITRSMNVAVEPCDDFYEFACGKYIEELEPDKPTNWFNEKTKNISEEITKILEEMDRTKDLRSLKKARRLYKSCLDTDTLNDIGYEPVFKILDMVGLPRKFPDFTAARYVNGVRFNVARTLGLIQRYLGMDIMVQLSMEANPKNNLTTMTVGPVSAYTSKLPEPLYDYHRPKKIGQQRPFDIRTIFDDEEFNKKIAMAKVEYMMKIIISMFPEELFNTTALARFCVIVLTFEANLLKKDVDYEKKGEEFTTGGLRDYMYSNTTDTFGDNLFDWQSFVDHFTTDTNVTWTMSDTILVRNPEYFLELQSKLIDTPLEEIQQFLWWRVVESLAIHTTTTMIQLREKFFDVILPSPKRLTRQEFCTTVTKSILKYPVAYEFYSRHDLKDTTKKVFEMISQLQYVFKNMISESDWMDEETKRAIFIKLDALKVGVGYPKIFETPDLLDKQFDYVKIIENEYLQTIVNINVEELIMTLDQLGKPENNAPKQIMTDPLEVNAFYNRLENSINIPAGILRVPFFNKGVDVVNYGAIGSIIGHEITHGFDIEGKNYDSHGHKSPQWTLNAEREYLFRALCFVNQYDKFKIGSNIQLNGTHTLGENMADNVGLKQSWKAYKSNNIGEGFHLPGLTEYSNDQLFFLSYANVWCRKPNKKNDEQITYIINDEHSPSTARVLGSLRNSPEFSEAWKCPAGSPMNPSYKCSMW
ncbi:endothelin-converting enzyme 2-like isoform X1 [Rhopalosiphum maidis]|uniref:endothelin-converting enzyme 2-like isoform X1 n=1 Tax=Rhopalosiphum maidis TaxID=43146 RepID=UPI000F006EFD|nr:endothelin-converting enzyme 2-like isoform X1 [Rhopalosiphum maidis]